MVTQRSGKVILDQIDGTWRSLEGMAWLGNSSVCVGWYDTGEVSGGRQDMKRGQISHGPTGSGDPLWNFQLGSDMTIFAIEEVSPDGSVEDNL